MPVPRRGCPLRFVPAAFYGLHRAMGQDASRDDDSAQGIPRMLALWRFCELLRSRSIRLPFHCRIAQSSNRLRSFRRPELRIHVAQEAQTTAFLTLSTEMSSPSAKKAKTERTFLFSSESVNEGHPDKLAGQVQQRARSEALRT